MPDKKSNPTVESNLLPHYTFDTYVEGEFNRLAYQGGRTVAKKPGNTSFNPLLIFGGAGLGKTHLATAIGWEVKKHFPEKNVIYVSAERFGHQFSDSVKTGTTLDFIQYYQRVSDVLIIDDVQFFMGKKATQDVFFQIFNHLHQLKKQLIFTADKSPAEMGSLEDRLLSRFKMGLCAPITLPDSLSRSSIIQKKLQLENETLPAPIIEFLAKQTNANIRELEGILISIVAQASLAFQPLTIDLAKQITGSIIPLADTAINNIKNTTNALQKIVLSTTVDKQAMLHSEATTDAIKKGVCEALGVEEDVVFTNSRKKEVVIARHIILYLCKTLTSKSLNQIGNEFGRDHSTVSSAYRTVSKMITNDDRIQAIVNELREKLVTN